MFRQGVHRAGGDGFSLLELLIVLALIGLLAAVVVPSVGRQINTRTEQAELQSILAVIAGLPVRAMLEGKVLAVEALPSSLHPANPIPPYWQVSFDPQLTVTPAPSCSGAKVTIKNTTNPAQERLFRVEARTCRLNAIKDPSVEG